MNKPTNKIFSSRELLISFLCAFFVLSVFTTTRLTIKPKEIISGVGATASLPPLPEGSDWKNEGIAIREGIDGQWDRYLWGGFSNNIIKKGNTYFLYYQGSEYYDDTCESVAKRSIGVATSTDGINWTKYSGNPVITWKSKGSIEEGAASSGTWLGADGKVYLYYGANSGTGCNVNAAGRLAVSSDGLKFTDTGEVISPNNSSIWGYGDELFPVGAYEYGGKWNVYYIPNGVSYVRKLGVISGDSPASLTSASSVNFTNLPAWGPVSAILNGTSSYLFVNDPRTGLPVRVYRFNPTSPANLTLDKTYTFSDCSQASVLFDNSANKWLMLCREKTNASQYLVKTAKTAAAVTNTPSPTPTIKPGDCDGDNDVDIFDFRSLSNSFGKSLGQTGYDAGCDFVPNNTIDIFDFQTLSNNFGS